MRGKTASRLFRARKKFDVLLASLLPGVYLLVCTTCHTDLSRLSLAKIETARRGMVTFARIPYAEAGRRARQRDRVVYVGAIISSMLIAAAVIAALARGLPAG